MSAQRRHQQYLPEQMQQQVTVGVAATVTDDDGTIVITVSRHVEAIPAGSRPEKTLTVVAVDGEIDYDTAPLLQAALVQALNGRPRVCCDMAKVTFFGAAGANILLAAHRQANDLDRVFFLRGVNGVTGRVLEIIDPAKMIPR